MYAGYKLRGTSGVLRGICYTYTQCDIVAGIADTGIPCCWQRIAAAAAAVAVAAAAEVAADAGDAIRRYEGGMAAMGRARADPTRRHWTPQLYNDPACPSHDADDSRGRSYFRSLCMCLSLSLFFFFSIHFGLSFNGAPPLSCRRRRCSQHLETVNSVIAQSLDARLIRSLAELIDRRAPRGT